MVHLPVSNLILAATYTMNYATSGLWTTGHIWSLSVEEQFYLIWPVTLCLLGTKRAIRAAALLGIAAPIVCLVVYVFGNAYFGRVSMAFPFVADSIAFGCVPGSGASETQADSRIRSNSVLLRRRLRAPLPSSLSDCLRNRPRLHLAFGELLLNVSICYCVARYTQFPNLPGSGLLNTRFLTLIGRLSYSLYLWQQPFMNRFGVSTLQVFPLNVLAACSCAALSYYLIEQPFAAMRKNFRPGGPPNLAAGFKSSRGIGVARVSERAMWHSQRVYDASPPRTVFVLSRSPPAEPKFM